MELIITQQFITKAKISDLYNQSLFKIRLLDKNSVQIMDKHRELREVAKDLGYNPESVIFLRNGLPVPDDEIPKEGEEIILMKAFSGG